MKNARKASLILQDAGFKAYVVGGAVRDSLMGVTPKDWDLATDATPDQVTFLFGQYKVIPTGIEFGTVTVMMCDDWMTRDDAEPIEITTFRDEQEYSDGRRPDAVTFSKTIEEDLSRRDFTCNAIAWDVVAQEFVDPHNGRSDIVDGVLRCVGDPNERFAEDGLRIMRAYRFMATKGFNVTWHVSTAAHVQRHMLNNVSKERIHDELLKLLVGEGCVEAMYQMMADGIWEIICPALCYQVGLVQNRYHALPCWEHTMSCVHNCESNDPIMLLAVLLHDIAKPDCQTPHPKNPGEYQFLRHEDVGADMAEAWMREYKFSNEDIERVKHIIQHHLIMYIPQWSNAAVRRWVQRVGKESIPDLMCMARCDLLGKELDVTKPLAGLQELLDRIANMKEPILSKTSELAISGHDVMKALGLTKGNASVGAMMDHLLAHVTEYPDQNTVDGLQNEVLYKIADDLREAAENPTPKDTTT